jgi:hypothetical protein
MAGKQEVADEQTEKKFAEFDWALYENTEIEFAELGCAEVGCAACKKAAIEQEARAQNERAKQACRAKIARILKDGRESQRAHRAKNAAQNEAMIVLASR